MKTEQLPLKKDTTKKARRSLVAGITVSALVIFSLVFLGMKIEQRNYEKPLPANQSCLLALDIASKALAGEQADLATAIQDCKANQTKYEVTQK